MESKNNNPIILPPTSPVYKAFSEATNKRMVFFTGLSGVGKSLYIQQFSKMAELAGRKVHLLQWDVTREAFQNEQNLAKYPEIDGVTHSVIRKAVGLWTRKGIEQWHQQYPAAEHLLIGELPLIGNRLIEVVQQLPDPAEELLASDQTHFFLPVPSQTVRDHIVSCRTESINHPAHEREAADAPPSVVESMWQQIRQIAIDLEKVSPASSTHYDANVYKAGYEYLLQHRHSTTLDINDILDTRGSVYEIGRIYSELTAQDAEVKEIYEHLEEHYTLNQIAEMVDNWHRI